MTKNKDKKGKESTIGKIIYGFLLFMPLLAIGVTSLYAIFNKNAYQSYSDELVDKSISINASNQDTLYIQNQTIHWVYDESKTFSNASSWFGFKEISVDFNELLNTENVNYIAFKFYTSQWGIIQVLDSNNQQRNLQNPLNHFKELTWVADLNNGAGKNPYTYGNAYVLTYTTQKLDNVFYYSINQVEQSNLFNWAKNSIVYTTLVTTCNALSITNTFIPMLLAYWLIISVIYILYDIALMMIIIFHHKIHCLQDSI